jgi:endonuclease YncB( thermonuclease family)
VRTLRLAPAARHAAALIAGLAVVFLGVLLAHPAIAAGPGQALRGTVASVIDGDTIRVKVLGGATETVRLIGVNSQELNDTRESVRLMAFWAKRFAWSRLYRQQVDLLPGPETRDSYGRLLAFVRTPDGGLFNVALVREGYAFAFLKFPFDESLRKELQAAERQARQEGKGLWRKEPYPVIAVAEAMQHVGEILTVHFYCLRQFARGGFIVLEGVVFDAVIPSEVFRALPGPLDFGGRRIDVTGFVELYKGRPQIVIGLPVQLKSVDR